MGFFTADKFSDHAANLICQELGFQHAVDWTEFLINETEKYFEGKNSINDYLSVSNLYCEEGAGEFNDCSYNVTRLQSVALPLIILSCNPEPGEITIFFIYKPKLI